MKEALKIIEKLIDEDKITGEEAVILIKSINKEQQLINIPNISHPNPDIKISPNWWDNVIYCNDYTGKKPDPYHTSITSLIKDEGNMNVTVTQ